MKSRTLFFLMFLSCFTGSYAQQPAAKTFTVEERAETFVTHIAPKLSLNKTQKDSLTTIYVQYIDDVEKYHAMNNEKVVTFLMNSRDEKVKKLLHDQVKFDKYLLLLADMKNQRDQQPGPQNQSPEGPKMH